MSRVVFLGDDNKKQGELMLSLNRGWMLGGHPDVYGGGDTKIALTEEEALQPFLQFGRMVMVAHPKLPLWAGVIEPIWNAALPVQMTVYNTEYLLSQRCPDKPELIEGSVGAITAKIIELFNVQGDRFLRIGDTSRADNTVRQETLDERNFWDQLWPIVARSGCEMQMRPAINSDGQLIIYVDVARQLGVNTGFLFSDGEHGNATFSELAIDGPIVNRVIGINDGSGQESRLRTDPFIHEASAQIYGIRSKVVQFQNIREQGTLELYAKNYLNFYAMPRFSFFVTVTDKGDAFYHCRLGNLIQTHISKARMPGAVKGYRGPARILAMAHDEANNQLGLKVGLL